MHEISLAADGELCNISFDPLASPSVYFQLK
jgi:hypothetical protein